MRTSPPPRIIVVIVAAVVVHPPDDDDDDVVHGQEGVAPSSADRLGLGRGVSHGFGWLCVLLFIQANHAHVHRRIGDVSFSRVHFGSSLLCRSHSIIFLR